VKEQTHLPDRHRPVIWDRQTTLAAIDRRAMIDLAGELLGAHRGTDRSPAWPCPSHDGQTGRTPPVSIFSDRLGEQRWKCHACGAGGTAVDLLMQTRGMTVREALGELARRTGTPPLAPGRRPAARARPPGDGRNTAPATQQLINPFFRRTIPELDRYVQECAEVLWRPEGSAARRWLTESRGLPERVLRSNRVGVDLGAARQARPDGVPAVRRAVVLPVLIDGEACFVQLRTLGTTPGFPKYLNSRESLAPNPRLAAVGAAPPANEAVRAEILVTEGIFDALSAAIAGYRAVAFLSAGYPDRAAAVALARLRGPLVVAFDPDPAGQAGARRLIQLLAANRRETALLRLTSGDLNDNAARSQDWPVELAARVEHATYPLTRLPPALVCG
jgi:hypothetical protein